ncbi:hypothetical protein D9O36_14800 [Zobellia amurskyensis]|uniref:DUF2383 domain-containing protein n=1 Tax=Zobellia amurskyensis TaxID=248905 RepID=A0A7X2ZVI1_9FLAO|nr:hypothetical protein [Zobellia amurskyensis]MUH37119.1 hypothetical protein [Zobellia amurskyensis]
MECLEQLLKVYVISEIRCIEGAANAKNPLMRMFMEQCAIERSDFILELWHTAIRPEENVGLSDFYAWHNQLYGKNYLEMTTGSNLNIALLDRKALEICECMIDMNLPNPLACLLLEQSTKIKADLLALVHIRALTEN